MKNPPHKARRPLWPLALLCLLSPMTAIAADAAAAPLTLQSVAQAALQQQPLLQAKASEIRAAQSAAIAASQLPDPQLALGLSDLTLEGRDRFTLDRESDTQFTAAFSQQFPRAEKRALRGQSGRQQAELLAAELDSKGREVRRDAELAFIDLWRTRRALAITAASARELALQRDAEQLRYASGGNGRQSEILAAQLNQELMQDKVAALQQETVHYQNSLARWIGAAAFSEVAETLNTPPIPDVEALVAQLSEHPHLQVEHDRLKLAETAAALARADYLADYSIEAGYGYRPAFSDYASLRVSFDLPVFGKNRQDQRLQAALASAEAARAGIEDAQREHVAMLRLNAADWQQLQPRLKRYRDQLLPDAQRRTESALAAYAAGAGDLNAVLMARRTTLEVQLQALELQADAARHAVQLEYFSMAGP